MVTEGRRKREEGRSELAPEPTSMPAHRGYRKLIAWQLADKLADAIFEHCQHQGIKPWLASQICRAGLSVPTNIVEGYTRGSVKDYLHFLDIARASLAETEYLLYFLHKHKLINDAVNAKIASLQFNAGNVLVALMRALHAKSKSGTWDRLGEERADYFTPSDINSLLPASFFLLPGVDGSEG